MDSTVKIFPTAFELAENFAEELVGMIKDSNEKGKSFTIALSGGSTPELLFSILGDHFAKSVPWEAVHFFWGDERCVPPDDKESNFGMTKRRLFDKIEIPSSNIHRIRGEEDTASEVLRYSDEILTYTNSRDGLPIFNLFILGLGEDGHTASIFPGNSKLFKSERVCEVAMHPVTNQKRITITGRVINNSERIVFLVSGNKKAVILENIINNRNNTLNFPASYIVPIFGKLTWYVDKEAAALL